MQRRDLLKKAGGIGAATAAGGAGLVAMTGGAAAAEFSFLAYDASARLDDGDVSEVYVDIDGNLSWENFDEEITQMEIQIDTRIPSEGSDWKTVRDPDDYEEPVQLPDDVAGKSGSYEGQVGSPELTLYSGHETDPFDADEDGTVNETDVDIRLTINLLNSDGEKADPYDEAQVKATATFTATAENLPASTSGSATGKTTME